MEVQIPSFLFTTLEALMKCPLCNDTGRLLAFTDQGVAPRCSCPSKTIGLIRLSEQGATDQHQQEAEIPRDDELVTLQAN